MVVRILVLTVAMTVIATIGLFLTTRSVQYLSEELQPDVSANQDIQARRVRPGLPAQAPLIRSSPAQAGSVNFQCHGPGWHT